MSCNPPVVIPRRLPFTSTSVRLGPRLRSPLVLRCIDDYLAGKRYPLELFSYL